MRKSVWLVALTPVAIALTIAAFIATGAMQNRRFFADLDVLAVVIGLILSTMGAAVVTIHEYRERAHQLETKAQETTRLLRDAEEQASRLQAQADEVEERNRSLEEEVERLRDQIRELGRSAPQLPVVRFDRTNRRAWLNDRELTLPPLELCILEQLLVHQGDKVERKDLFKDCWPDYAKEPDDRDFLLLNPRIAALRQALNDDPPHLIVAVRGSGYRFTGPRQFIP